MEEKALPKTWYLAMHTLCGFNVGRVWALVYVSENLDFNVCDSMAQVSCGMYGLFSLVVNVFIAEKY